ncbi:Vomp family autotransporter [Bartonella krasnovii]|uniref:Vomp family autotransporter n=1 Tax=Bartonella krasnovii TaxID=2267275 RepID=UPI001F4C87C8|nr:Vomp family autotransporter [Bartonella krasnovii]UNF47148.1 Vomp family autotransporter [Bartonella krasnovii]
MKELSVILKKNKWDSSPVSQSLSFSTKLSFGTAMAMLLLSGSPVVASNLAITGANILSDNSPAVKYPKGSHGSIVFSGDDDYCGADNVIGRGGTTVRTATAITVEEEYRRFLEYSIMNGFSPYSQSSVKQTWTGNGKTTGNIGYMGKDSTGGDQNIIPEAYGIYSFATGCGSAATGNYSVAFGANATARTGGSQAFGVAALASGKVTVAIGVGSEASGDAGVALGGLATASGERSIAIGTRSSAQGEESIAIGSGTKGEKQNNSALAMGIQAIAIGSHAVGSQDYSVVVGASAVASVSKGIALGYGSVADVGDGILGYNPMEDAPSKDKSATWKSSVGALSIGNPKENITRQITGVASGSEDTDAVNVAQLKALRAMITEQGSWDLVVAGAENIVIGSGEKLELKTGSNNFKITSDTRDKKVTFDLAKDITLDSVKLGGEDLAEAVNFVTLDATGLIVKDGPKITTTGISAGNKKITGVIEGTDETDAVNFAQLKGLQDNVNKGWSLSVGDENTKTVLMGDTVDFSALSKNLNITKGKDDNKVTFDLAKDITLESVKTGENTLDKTGLIIKDGPQITTTGVNAGNKKITGVKKGTDETDAVNFAQLKELKDSISTSTSKDGLSEWNKDKVRIGVPGNKAERKGAVAIGRTLESHETSVLADYGIAIGSGARVKENAKDAISFGRNSEVRTEAGVALGAFSIADRAKYVRGYDPRTGKTSVRDPKNPFDGVWENTYGAVSVGASNISTRQIMHVAAGSEDDDAVNVGQLKALRSMITEQGSWNLSVGDKKTVVDPGDTLTLAAENSNLIITSDDKEKKVTFDLAHDITLDSIKLGDNTLDKTGLTIKDGPRMTTAGIFAGNKKITGVQKGTENTDAVNFVQLKELQDNVNKGWNLSVGDKNTKAILMGDTVDFSALSKNLNITKGKDDNKVTFDLAKDITLDSIKLGDNTLDKTGLIIKNGPQVTTTGINAGNKKITGVQKGTENTDAVNFAQLKDAISTSTSKDQLSEWNKDTVRIGVLNDRAERKGAVAIGRTLEVHETSVFADYGIAIGSGARVKEKAKSGISIGHNSEVRAEDGVALGAFSSADRVNNVRGYDPRTGKPSVMDPNNPFDGVWRGAHSAVSVGHSNTATRQIIHVAAGSEDDDAVNVGQLKALRSMITEQGSWNLSVGDKKTVVDPGDTLILAAENSNLIITSDDKEKKVTFDLAHDITLESVKAGENTLDKTGLIIANGPKVMTVGIDAGNKKITGVAEGANDTDAVNFAQLKQIEKDVKEQVASSSFVKQNADTQHITIGKDTDGDKIDIANNKNEQRTLTGIKEAALSAESNEAVTGSQLFETNNDVTTLKNNFSEIQISVAGVQTNLSTIANNTSQYLGGDANVLNGKAPTYTFEDKSYHDVASAFSGVSSSFTEVKQQITNVNNSITNVENQIKNVVSESLVQQEKGTQHITIGKDIGGDKVDIANKNGDKRTLTGIKEAALLEDSNEAVTGSQLFETNNKVATYLGGGASYKDGKWSDPTFKVQTVDDQGNKKDEAYTDVAAAFVGVSTSIMNVQNKVTNDIKNKFSELNQNITNITQQVTGDALLWNDEAQAFAALHKKKAEEQEKTTGAQENSKITFLLDGAISKDSTDAITGKQLYSTSNTFATYLDKGAGYDAEGNWKAPNFKVKTVNSDGKEEDKTYPDVAEAFEGVGISLTNVQNKVTEQISSVINKLENKNLVKWNEEENLINIGKEKEGSEINITNTSGKDRTLSGVKAAINNNEAVNKEQFDKGLKDFSRSLQSDDSAVVHYDKKAEGGIDYTSVTLGGKDRGFTTLHNVADGIIADKSHDAITGGQIYKIGEDIAKFLGGNAAFSNGAFTGPTYILSEISKEDKVTNKSFNDVGSAFEGLDENIKNVNQRIKEVSEGVAQDSLSWSKKKGAFVAVHGEDGAKSNSKLTSLLDGTVSHGSTDAVTGSQLFETNKTVAKYLGGGAGYRDGVWSDPIFTVTTVNDKGKEEEKTYQNVAEAFEGVGTSITNVQNKVTNDITNKFNEFTQNITNITQQVQGDALLWSNTDNAFVADHKKDGEKTKSKITHLLDGDIASGSTDAVTGGQLYLMNEQLASYLGGGAGYDTEGKWQAPSFKVKTVKKDGNSEDKNYTNVADALAGVGTSFTNVQNKFTNEITNQINYLQSDDSAVIHYDKKDGTINYGSVTFGGKDKTPTSLHNVANGIISDKSHDAVTGGQIYKIGEDIAKFLGGNAAFNNGAFTQPTYKLSSVDSTGKIADNTFNDVGSAFVGLDENIKNVNQRIREVSEGVAQDSLSWSKEANAFVALHGKKDSKITHILGGDITTNSSDAVNGSQLYLMNNTLASYFGGGAEYKEGKWISPNFKVYTVSADGSKVEEQSYKTVAEAFAGVGSSFTNIHKELKNEINQVVGDSLVKQDEKTKRITIGGEKDGSEINVANSMNGVRSLSGVKAGLLAAESTEAINGSQLYSVINVLTRYFSGDAEYKDGKWLAPSFKVAQFTADSVVSKRENYTNVASAFEGVNESMIKINNRIHDVEQSIFSSGLNWSETEKAFDARHEGQDSKIKHVADGEISEGSKEAVNGSQLWQTNKKVKEVKSHVNRLDKQVKDIASVADIAVKYDKGNDGKKKNKVTLIGMSESDPVLIDNVADGRIESGSKEAVTGGQLYDYTDQQMNLVLSNAKRYTDERFNDIVNNTVNNVVNETKSYTDIKFEALRYEIKEIRKESKEAAAVGLAVSNLSYEDTPGSLSLSIGTGVWRNQYAFAIGAGYMSENGKIRSNISATSSGGHWGIGAGLRVKLN